MSKQSLQKLQDKRKAVVIAAIVVLALLIDIFITGLMKFGYNVVRCEGIPVKVIYGFSSSTVPMYVLPGNYTPGGAANNYLCTEKEAVDKYYVKGA